MQGFKIKTVLMYVMMVCVVLIALILAYMMLSPTVKTWINKADDNGKFLSGQVFTAKELEVNIMPQKLYYDCWDVPDGYYGDFVYEDYTFEHGFGMYIPNKSIPDGKVGVDQLGLYLGGRYDQMYFALCSDSQWTAYEESGLYRLMCYADGEVIYDSGDRDWTYYEDVYLDVAGVENFVFELHEIEGDSGTLNVILGELEVNILDR